jgi:hypothetical protein
LEADHPAFHLHVIGAEHDLQQINPNNGGT